MLIYRTDKDSEYVFSLSPSVVKFPEDCFCSDGELRTACEGYILNARELREKYGVPDNASLIEKLYRSEPQTLYDCFKGSFIIAIYDKAADSLTVINDLLSKKAVYYLRQPGGNIAAAVCTSFTELCSLLREHGEKLTPSSAGVMSMLNNRAMIFDVTYAEETGYLMPFERLEINGGELSVKRLPIPETDSCITADQAVETADRLFLEGCRLQLEKNKEGGYITAASLSGGMDSRAVLLAAERLGYTPDLCFTYAQSGSLDETIPQRIASDRGIPHFFHALDRGDFIKHREFAAGANDGQHIFCGTTGLPGVLQALDCGRIGILMIGIGGGEIMGDILTTMTKEQEPEFFRNKAKTLALPGKDADENIIRAMTGTYPSFHSFANINDIRTCTNFTRTASRSFEAASPFLYEDFFRYMLTVPSEIKSSRKLYSRWYADKMPSGYPTTGGIRLDRREGRLSFIRRKVSHRLIVRKQIKTKGRTRYDMNPFARWEEENPGIAKALDEYFAGDMERLAGKLDPELEAALRAGMKKSIVDKAAAVTATWTLRRMLCDD